MAVEDAVQSSQWVSLRSRVSGVHWRHTTYLLKRDEARDLLALVYGWFERGVRHARSEGGQGAA